jgi:hypothetical protein
MRGAESATCSINDAMIRAVREQGPKNVRAVSMVPEYMAVARSKKPMDEKMSMSAVVRRGDVDGRPWPLSVADSAVDAWLYAVVGSAANTWPFSAAEAALNGLAHSPASRAIRLGLFLLAGGHDSDF